ncbi:MAG: peptide deformylase [Anaerolineae bacterium]
MEHLTKLDIAIGDEPILRKKAAPVEKIDMALQTLIDRMILTMRGKKGVGLAAPQIKISKRLVVIETPPEYDDDGEDIPDSRVLYVMINPEILNVSRKQVTGIEGCLSLPGYLGEVSRSQVVMVQFLDRRGKKQKLRLRGWDARIVQHEVDHLDGIMFTDKLTAEENFWSEEEYDKKIEEERAKLAAEEGEDNG